MTTNQTPWDTNPAPGYKLHPDHKVACKPFKGEVTVTFNGEEIARSKTAWIIEETNHKPVYYLPAEDVTDKHLVASTHVTRCPFKGKARYWNLKAGSHEIDNAVWSYEMPYDEAMELAGLMAFYETKVEITATPAG